MTKWLRAYWPLASHAAGFFLLASQTLAAGLLPEPHSTPRLQPDYAGIVVPPNLAPLNFRILEPGVKYRVEWRSTRGNPIVITSRNPAIRIPQKPWADLLHANAGEPLLCDIAAQDQDHG